MLADPSLTAVGSWLATYWVHAGALVFATFILVHTALRRAPASVRATAWRAALVAPLLTATLRHVVFDGGPAIEVAWLEMGETTEPNAPLALGDGDDSGLALNERTIEPLVSAFGAQERERAVVDGTRSASADGADTSRADRQLDGASPLEAALASSALSPATPAAKQPSTWWTAIDPRRLALLAAIAAALLSLARWLDGWLRLTRRLEDRGPLPKQLATRAAALAKSMGVRNVRITQSARIAVPMAFGLVRREVCLPTGFEAGLTDNEWRAAVAHELAHHVRGDGRWLPSLRLLSRVLAFQPLNLAAWRELQRESEHAADDEAVRHTGAAEALALCLAKVAARIGARDEQLPAAAMTGAPTMASRPALVVERAERLVASIDVRPTAPKRSLRLVALAPAVLIAAFAPRLSPLSAAGTADAPIELHGEASTAHDNGAAMTHALVEAARELADELVWARADVEAALVGATDERREKLAALLVRLQSLEERTAQFEHVIHERGARAKAPPFDTSPIHDFERRTNR